MLAVRSLRLISRGTADSSNPSDTITGQKSQLKYLNVQQSPMNMTFLWTKCHIIHTYLVYDFRRQCVLLF